MSLDVETKRLTFKHQPDAAKSFEDPTPDEWYPVLEETRECRLYSLTVLVWTANEDLEVRVTLDGVVLLGSISANHTTYYYVHHQLYASGLTIDGNIFLLGKYAPLEGRNVKVEVRKTTATGSGTLDARVIWAKR